MSFRAFSVMIPYQYLPDIFSPAEKRTRAPQSPSHHGPRARQMPYPLEPRAFAGHWRRSPLKRANRAGPAACHGLDAAADDETALARGLAAWELGRLTRRRNDERAASRLKAPLASETDAWMREKIGLALGQGNETPGASSRRDEYKRIVGSGTAGQRRVFDKRELIWTSDGH